MDGGRERPRGILKGEERQVGVASHGKGVAVEGMEGDSMGRRLAGAARSLAAPLFRSCEVVESTLRRSWATGGVVEERCEGEVRFATGPGWAQAGGAAPDAGGDVLRHPIFGRAGRGAG